MKSYKGIIFDLDGTLLDTINDIADSMNRALEKSGYPSFINEEYKIKIGNGFRILVERCLPLGIDEATISKVHKSFVEDYNNNYMNNTLPYDGILEILKLLESKGIKLGINSNKRDDFVQKMVSKYFGDIDFVRVIGALKEIPNKPDPYSANEIAKSMNLDVSEILYIGDSDTDIYTAKNAGIDGAGVLWGFRSYGELKDAGAKYLFANPQELIQLF